MGFIRFMGSFLSSWNDKPYAVGAIPIFRASPIQSPIEPMSTQLIPLKNVCPELQLGY